MKTLNSRITSVMAIVFEMDETAIQVDANPDTIPQWDSLRHINLIMALEEEFSIVFTDQETLELLNMALIENIITQKITEKK